MTAYSIRTSRQHESILPRSPCDAHRRFLVYGPIQPMEDQRGLLAWLFRRG